MSSGRYLHTELAAESEFDMVCALLELERSADEMEFVRIMIRQRDTPRVGHVQRTSIEQDLQLNRLALADALPADADGFRPGPNSTRGGDMWPACR